MASFYKKEMIDQFRDGKCFRVRWGQQLTFAKIRRRIQGPSGAPEISTTVYRSPSVVATIRIIGNGVCGLNQRVRKLLGTKCSDFGHLHRKKKNPMQAKRWD